MALNSGWADSVYTSMKETLQDFGISWHSVTHLLQDFSQAVLKMKGLADAIAQQEGNLVLDRMTAMDLCRSVARAVPIDSEDEDFIRVVTPMSGLADVLDRLMLRMAEAGEMPVTLLFGQSPAGLNATGESDIRFFYDGIKASQEETVRPRIDRLLDVLFASKAGPTKGTEPENWSYEFNPLWQETDSQRAETRKAQAEADVMYIENGVLDEEEVAMSRFGGDTYSSETVLDMEKRLAEPEEEDEPPPPPQPAVPPVPGQPVPPPSPGATGET
jgi:phage-related protein (TIGR01555 family)